MGLSRRVLAAVLVGSTVLSGLAMFILSIYVFAAYQASDTEQFLMTIQYGWLPSRLPARASRSSPHRMPRRARRALRRGAGGRAGRGARRAADAVVLR